MRNVELAGDYLRRARIRLAFLDALFDEGGWPDVVRRGAGGGVEWLGAMRDAGDIVGDIVSPASDPSDWAVLRAEMVERCPDISVIPGA